jgi:hypothetical protein
MRSCRVTSSLVFFLVALLATGGLTSCSEENWTYEGVHQVLVESISAPDTLDAADTLSVILEGCVPEYGNAEFSHVDTVRDTHHVELTVWADCWSWTGSGTMPPLPWWVRCEPEVLPPFYPGRLVLVAIHRDSSTVSDTVQVLP